MVLAAQQGEVEVVHYLLEKGADPSSRETFFGMSVLDVALWKGAPDYEVAKALLAAGATDRAEALALGLQNDDVALARAAAASGPVLESEAADLRARFGELQGELKEILAAVETEPDPPGDSGRRGSRQLGGTIERDPAVPGDVHRLH